MEERLEDLSEQMTLEEKAALLFQQGLVVPEASMSGNGFSSWPEPIGLAATRDEELVREFGDIARREYLAVGIRLALHPMAELATEPRWCRAAGTFGEDAELPGGGPQLDGEDPHFQYGREQVYPGGNFEYHLGSGSAALHVADIAIGDFGNVVNALTGGSPIASALVSFDVDWSGVDERVKIRNDSTDFAGEFIRNSARLEWSATQSGFSFTSDPGRQPFRRDRARAERRLLRLGRRSAGRRDPRAAGQPALSFASAAS